MFVTPASVSQEGYTVQGQGIQRPLLGARDWVYLLSLLVPLVVYNLVLKGVRVASWPGETGFWGGLGLMRSDLLFNLGYALLWIGLFAVARKGLYRWVVVVLFHAVTILVALVTTGAHRYYQTTGWTLDLDVITLSLSSLEGTGGIIASEVTPGLLLLVVGVLGYALLGPFLISRFVSRKRSWPGTASIPSRSGVPWLGVLGVALMAYGLLFFSLLPGGSAGASKSFSRDAFVNIAMEAVEDEDRGETSAKVDPGTAAEKPPEADATLLATRFERRNVVLVHLESTRAGSVTPYNEELETTPFMDELAKKSLLAENARANVPHTTNALTATMCGVQPPLEPEGTDSLGDDIPGRCLPELLGEQGYNSVYFTSSVQTFERRPEVVENMGYEEFYPVETMETEGFEKANYFGYEDDVMLEPSKKWLEKNRDKPFIAAYETITPHHDYQAPKRYGLKDFAEDEELNRYQNSVRYVDFFLKNLFDQYKEMGLYEDTVFVIYGDHGEGFGEHGRRQHDNTIYDEGLKIPLMIHDPRQFQNGERVEEPVTQLDVLPTVADLLGYKVRGEGYPGSSLMALPEDRTLNFSCWNESGCMASVKGSEKYVYHYGDQPDELFDLSKDPEEKNNLAGELNDEELEKRRVELLEWRARVNAMYGR
jgi:lipoteichoic acid synthase